MLEPIRTVGVNALLSGILLSLKVEEGHPVSQGDVLAEIDARELEAQARSAEAALRFAQSTVERSEQLFRQQIITIAELERDRAAHLTLPDGYGLIIGGEQEAIEDTNSQMVLVIGLAIFLVFVVLAVQYESVLDPLIILTAVPLGLIGVIAILGITDTPFSAPVFLGMIMLAGIVVNNSILLVEFTNQFRGEGEHSIGEAAGD